MNKVKALLFFFFFIFNSNFLSAQNKLIFDSSRIKVGFISGYGTQSFNSVLSLREIFKSTEPNVPYNYQYNVYFFQLQFYYAVLRKQTWGIDALFQPQYNITEYKYTLLSTTESRSYEMGLNGGLLIRKNFLNDLLSFYALVSSGPHYVAETPQRQARGFIFSDNFLIGANVRIYKALYLDVRTGIRHISNAGLQEPNASLDDVVLSGGIFVVI